MTTENATVETMTLRDYASGRENVLLFWVGVGRPGGEATVIGHPDLDFAERRNLLDLTGTVDVVGNWQWDGEGKPTDDRQNAIYKLTAYENEQEFAELVADYECNY